MLSTLMILAALAQTAPEPSPAVTQSAAEEGSAAPIKQPAPPTAADSIVAAAFKDQIGTAKQTLQGAPEISTGSLVVPGLALIGLAGLAFGLSRRKRMTGAGIRVLESASLGPKRTLVIAEVLGERLVLGVSEAGIAVLMSKPVAAAPAAPPDTGFGADFAGFDGVIPGMPEPHTPSLRPASPPSMGFFQRLRGKSASPSFEASLNESIEDQELRAKLAAGMRGVVP